MSRLVLSIPVILAIILSSCSPRYSVTYNDKTYKAKQTRQMKLFISPILAKNIVLVGSDHLVRNSLKVRVTDADDSIAYLFNYILPRVAKLYARNINVINPAFALPEYSSTKLIKTILLSNKDSIPLDYAVPEKAAYYQSAPENFNAIMYFDSLQVIQEEEYLALSAKFIIYDYEFEKAISASEVVARIPSKGKLDKEDWIDLIKKFSVTAFDKTPFKFDETIISQQYRSED